MGEHDKCHCFWTMFKSTYEVKVPIAIIRLTQRSWLPFQFACLHLLPSSQLHISHSSALSSAYSRGHKWCTGRKYSLFFVLTLTALSCTRMPLPGYASVTRPRCHSPRLALGLSNQHNVTFLQVMSRMKRFVSGIEAWQKLFTPALSETSQNLLHTMPPLFRVVDLFVIECFRGKRSSHLSKKRWFEVGDERSCRFELTYVMDLEFSNRSAPQMLVWSSSSLTSVNQEWPWLLS